MPETERHPKWEREREAEERKKSSVTNTDTGSV